MVRWERCRGAVEKIGEVDAGLEPRNKPVIGCAPDLN
jgi:hypothetical protein